jgi:thiol-disulfide isomerase/thioredoxin
MSSRLNKILCAVFIFIGLSAWAYALSDFKMTAAENAPLRLMQRDVALASFPLLRFEDAAGQGMALSDFNAEFLLINFWATWCPPCIKEMPDLDALQNHFDSSFLKVMTLSVDQDKALAVDFFAEKNFQNLKLYYDRDKMAMSEKLITGLPVTYLVDRNLKVLARLEGITKWDNPEVIKDLREITGAK